MFQLKITPETWSGLRAICCYPPGSFLFSLRTIVPLAPSERGSAGQQSMTKLYQNVWGDKC